MSECTCASEKHHCDCAPAPGPGLQLAIATVPMQPWMTPYEPSKALKQGTIFPCLDLPFFITGGGSDARA